jgi:hypothetical protein
MSTPEQEGKKVGRKVSLREMNFVKGLVTGKSQKQAMRDAGYKESTVQSKASAKVKQLAPIIQALMEKRGLTDDRLLDVLDDGLKANKVISCNIIVTNKEGMGDADSVTKDFIEVEDHPTRHKFLDTALKLKRHMKDKDDQQPITVIIQKL